MASLRYQDDFIVGGSPNTRVSPNFRLREFAAPDGQIRTHRELAAGLQVLRDQYGGAIDLRDPRPATSPAPGLALVVAAEGLGRLTKQARSLKKDGWFKRVSRADEQLYLEMPDPSHLPAIPPATAFDYGMQVTAAFETRGDPYQQVTGNFDGAGLSFGPIQCNLGTGTLQDLFRRLRGEDEPRLRHSFENDDDYRQFWKILDGSRKKAVKWADSQSTGKNKYQFSQPWKGYLQAIGSEPIFRRTILRFAYDRYGKRMMADLAYLAGLSPVTITNLRCLAALYDTAVQQGGLARARVEIRRRVFEETPTDQITLTRIAVEERAKKANPRWQADCMSRRLGILARAPVAVSRNGQRARRTNPRVYLLRNSPVQDLEQYLAPEVGGVG